MKIKAMKKLSIIILFALVAMISCTKSKEVHPEIGDGNDELITVGINNISVKYIRNDIANIQKVVFHYSITDAQQFDASEMTKTSDCFVLTLNNLQSDTLYSYYYELFPYNGNSFNTNQKTFRTQSSDTPAPPTVITEEVSDITSNTAQCSGRVINDGGSKVTERGICWSTIDSPTISDCHVAVGMGTGTFTVSISGLEANTTYHFRAYAINEKGTAYGLNKEATTIGSDGGHDYINLGLPSGTLWATCNVGADTPEGYGDYFAWGETRPKDYYDWSTYQYCNGNYDQLTKYCVNANYGYNGFFDNLTVLQPSDDAARANWGNGWCIPTKEQFVELLQNTSNIWTTQNGVCGMLFTASNGRSLFLPAAGVRVGDVLGNDGILGVYHSSLLYTYHSTYSWHLWLTSDDCFTGNNPRGSGKSVRAVRFSN